MAVVLDHVARGEALRTLHCLPHEVEQLTVRAATATTFPLDVLRNVLLDTRRPRLARLRLEFRSSYTRCLRIAHCAVPVAAASAARATRRALTRDVCVRACAATTRLKEH